MLLACSLFYFFRFFERLEHDFEFCSEDRNTEKISDRIRRRFTRHMSIDIPREKPSNEKKWFTPPFGLPTKKLGARLYTLLAQNKAQLDSFEGSAATTQKWFPYDSGPWLFFHEHFDRTEMESTPGQPVSTACLKMPAHGDEDPMWMCSEFFHFFLGGLVEGSETDCTENGRFAIKIRAKSLTRPALFIDNGLQRPSFEHLSQIFDRQADRLLEGGSGPVFRLRNPTGFWVETCFQGLLAPAEHQPLRLFPGECVRFQFQHDMEVQMQKPLKVKLSPPNLSLIFASLLA
jgi:hypothetical protein